MSHASRGTAGSRRPVPEAGGAKNFEFTASESWKSLFDIGVRAYYLGEWGAGRWACEQLLSQDDVPFEIRERARRNQAYYAQHIAEIVPGTVVQPVVIPVPPGRSRFNPSIEVNGNGYRMIVRSTNHVVHRMRYGILGGGSTIQTDNYLLDLDADLRTQRIVCLQEQLDGVTRFPFHARGFEDCRLFQFRGSWYATSTTSDFNALGVCQITFLQLHEDGVRIMGFLNDPVGGRNEKNWMPLVTKDELLFIYSCRPTIVLRYDWNTGTALEEICRHPGPMIASSFRGGSQAVEISEGYLFVVHEAIDFIEDADRVYLHRFVLMDRSFTVTSCSPQFYFLDRAIEFCAGLAIREGTVILSFAFMDRDAYLAVMPLQGVLASLRPV